MEIYKIGKIVNVGKSYIILETHSTGVIINVANVQDFKKDTNRKVYVYEYKTEFTHSMYGFASFKERMLFEDLIGVNGVGPKTAQALLKGGADHIIQFIITADSKSLSSFPYLGGRAANQIIFELGDKYKNLTKHSNQNNNAKKMILPIEATNSLKTLGFNKKQIDYAIQNIKPAENIELLVENAIKKISDAKFA